MKYVKIEGGTKLASFIFPMAATLSDQPAFDDVKWVFEIKWDGYRAIAELAGKENNESPNREFRLSSFKFN